MVNSVVLPCAPITLRATESIIFLLLGQRVSLSSISSIHVGSRWISKFNMKFSKNFTRSPRTGQIPFAVLRQHHAILLHTLHRICRQRPKVGLIVLSLLLCFYYCLSLRCYFVSLLFNWWSFYWHPYTLTVGLEFVRMITWANVHHLLKTSIVTTLAFAEPRFPSDLPSDDYNDVVLRVGVWCWWHAIWDAYYPILPWRKHLRLWRVLEKTTMLWWHSATFMFLKPCICNAKLGGGGVISNIDFKKTYHIRQFLP